MVTQIYKIQSEICVPPSEIWWPQHIKILARFCITLWLYREYLRNATRHSQSENGVANYGHTHTGELNLCTLIHKRQKVGPEFSPTQWAAIMLGIATHIVILMQFRAGACCAVVLSLESHSVTQGWGHPNFWPNFINLGHHRTCGKVWRRSAKRPRRLDGEKNTSSWIWGSVGAETS